MVIKDGVWVETWWFKYTKGWSWYLRPARNPVGCWGWN
jgi:hypothetical protein